MNKVDCIVVDSPIFRARVHPHRPLLVATSASRDEFYLCEWGSGRLELTARLGSAHDLNLGPGTRDYLNYNLFNCVEFHPSEDVMAFAGWGRPIELRQASDWALVDSISGVHTRNLRWLPEPFVPPSGDGYCQLTFSSSGQYLVAINLASFVVEVYDFATLSLVGHLPPAECLTLHPNDDVVVAAYNDVGAQITISSITGRCDVIDEPPHPYFTSIEGMVFSPHGNRLAVIHYEPLDPNKWEPGACVTILDYPSLKPVFEYRIELPPQLPSWMPIMQISPIERVAFSPDGDRLLVPSGAGFITEIDSSTGHPLSRWKAHDDMITTVDLRHRDCLLITGGSDGKIEVWVS